MLQLFTAMQGWSILAKKHKLALPVDFPSPFNSFLCWTMVCPHLSRVLEHLCSATSAGSHVPLCPPLLFSCGTLRSARRQQQRGRSCCWDNFDIQIYDSTLSIKTDWRAVSTVSGGVALPRHWQWGLQGPQWGDARVPCTRHGWLQHPPQQGRAEPSGNAAGTSGEAHVRKGETPVRTEGEKQREKQLAGGLAAARGQPTTRALSIFTSLDTVIQKKTHVSQEEQEDKSSTNF